MIPNIALSKEIYCLKSQSFRLLIPNSKKAGVRKQTPAFLLLKLNLFTSAAEA